MAELDDQIQEIALPDEKGRRGSHDNTDIDLAANNSEAGWSKLNNSPVIFIQVLSGLLVVLSSGNYEAGNRLVGFHLLMRGREDNLGRLRCTATGISLASSIGWA